MKILYLYPKKYYDSKMSLGRVWYAEAVAAQAELEWWGPGWEGWDDDLSLRDNLKKTKNDYDWIWFYKQDLIKNPRDRDCPAFVCYNEAWPHIPKRAVDEVEMCGAELVIHHHANDAPCFDDCKAEVRHIPHGAPISVFASVEPLQCRTGPAVLTGVQSKEIYPLRDRYRVLAQSGAFSCRIRNHPGYRLQSNEQCRKQANNYANDLKSSKVSLCCTSKYKYLLAKIIESMMAGCVVITDAADDPWFEKIRNHVIVLEDGVSDEGITRAVKSVLSEPMRWEMRSRAAHSFAVNHLSTDKYAERLIATINEVN